MIQTKTFLLGLLCAIVIYGNGAAGDWVKVSDALMKTLQGKVSTVPGARGIGGIAVDRHSGHLYAALQGSPHGVYRSKNAGQTWELFAGADTVSGAWVRSFSIRIDQDRPGRMAFFRISPPGPANLTVTLDGGKSWRPIVPPKHKFTGFVHGMVDWSDDKAMTLVGHLRFRPKIMISRDGGKAFKDSGAGKKDGIFEFNWTYEWVRAYNQRSWQKFVNSSIFGYGVSDGKILVGTHDGIEVRGLDEKKRKKVADYRVSAYTPERFSGKLWWGAEEGLLVSTDKGESWSLLGDGPKMIRKGPFFGKDEQDIVVVCEDGVYRTIDGGKAWTKVSELHRDETCWRPNAMPKSIWQRHEYAYDHTRQLLYVAGIAGSCYKKQIQ